MSEYQYFEFQAVDRPLTEKEMAELRRCSTRARITPTSFVNEYNWGNFKGDPGKWMARYFDAFLYLTNWGVHELMLGIPSALLDLKKVQKYCAAQSAFAHEKSGRLILSFLSEGEDSEWEEDRSGLASLISIRSDLQRGDLRALYLGWLLCAQTGELNDEDEEPPVPPGLRQLSASLENFVKFLRIDRDIICAAAQPSAPLEDVPLKVGELKAWLAGQPADYKDTILARLMVDGGRSMIADMLQRYYKSYSSPSKCENAVRRTVGDLLSAAKEHAEKRRRVEKERNAREKAQQEREATVARAKYLENLVGRESLLWKEVHSLIATRQPRCYDRAVKLLIDLRDLYAHRQSGDFEKRLEEIRRQHARKSRLIERLRKNML